LLLVELLCHPVKKHLLSMWSRWETCRSKTVWWCEVGLRSENESLRAILEALRARLEALRGRLEGLRARREWLLCGSSKSWNSSESWSFGSAIPDGWLNN
jgi:hypothetical protein